MRIFRQVYKQGLFNATCDRCGWTFKSNQLRAEWTGLRTCKGPGTNDCWEARHPQDFLRGRRDKQAPPWVRPDPGIVVEYGVGGPITDENGLSLLDEDGSAITDGGNNANDVQPGDL